MGNSLNCDLGNVLNAFRPFRHFIIFYNIVIPDERIYESGLVRTLYLNPDSYQLSQVEVYL